MESSNDSYAIRSTLAFDFFNKAKFVDRTKGIINIEGKDYTIVTSKVNNFSTQSLASFGSTKTREILLLDPTSYLLDFHYEKLKEKLQSLQQENGKLSNKQIFKQINKYVKNEIFFFKPAKKKERKEKIKSITENKPKVKWDKKTIPVVTIDEFIKKGVGVCRHHALTSAYLLDRLAKEENPILKGRVFQIRDFLNRQRGGAHTWNFFIIENGENENQEKWHIDSYWNIAKKFKESEKYLIKKYGQEAIEHEKEIGEQCPVTKEEKIAAKKQTQELIEQSLINEPHFRDYFEQVIDQKDFRFFYIEKSKKKKNQRDTYKATFIDNLISNKGLKTVNFQVLTNGRIFVPKEKRIFKNLEEMKKHYGLLNQITQADVENIKQTAKQQTDLIWENYFKPIEDRDFISKIFNNLPSREFNNHYFIRKSNTFKDTYVLTYNHKGKIGSLRFRLSKTGQIQTLKDNTEEVEKSYSIYKFIKKYRLIHQLQP